ncbi:MAG TPA: hypothetical protein VMY06_12910 [Sedimentisphaerales bacterium]|nr:hypothetical protein [Sedimentisphaerales bacterium]
MRMIVLVLVAFVVSGCAMGLPGQTMKTVSEFDKATEIRMEPAFACSRSLRCKILLGFYRTSRMDSNEVVMIAEVMSYGHVEYPVFAAGKSLHFKVDTHGLTPVAL